MPFRKLARTKVPLVEDARAFIRVPARVALALVAATAGLAAVALLEPLLSRPYFFPAFAAIIVPAVVVGTRYGVLTTVMFAVGYADWFLAPRHQLAVTNPYELAALVAYAVTGGFVAVIGGALRKAYGELQEQHDLLDRVHGQREDLLRALTHDIRSPLSVISMNAAMLGKCDPATARRGALIQKSVADINSMLRDLVDAAALESGRLKLEPAAIDLAAMLNRLKEGLTGSLPVERVNVAVAPDVPLLEADPQRLERVLVNLISNALKYSPGEVKVRAFQQERNVLVSVSDEGPGISQADLPHIFEKYYRASGAASQDGLGLGLYISRLLVEAHGGRIWVESAPGKGCTFNVAMPAARPAAPSGSAFESTPQGGA